MIRLKIFTILLLAAQMLIGQIKNPKDIPFNWDTDLNNATIDLSELIMVVPRGNFQVLNNPPFVGKEIGLDIFYEREPVIFVEIDGAAKAYPLNMLAIHEIANDNLSGVPILVTFCPLCNSGVIFDRRLKYNQNEYLLEFEVSGLLRNSDMVMGDKQTETFWQQLTGEGIVGELAGAELKIIPSMVVSVKEYFKRFPDGNILSKSVGSQRAQFAYGKNFYVSYDNSSGQPYAPFFNEDKIDSRLPAMERIVEIRSRGEFKVYPFSAVEEKGVINDEFNSKNVVLFHKEGVVSILDERDITESKDVGSVTVFNSTLNGTVLKFRKEGENFIDDATNSIWDITGACIEGDLEGEVLEIEPHGIHFAFAWLAFHPESKFYIK